MELVEFMKYGDLGTKVFTVEVNKELWIQVKEAKIMGLGIYEKDQFYVEGIPSTQFCEDWYLTKMDALNGFWKKHRDLMQRSWKICQNIKAEIEREKGLKTGDNK